MRFEIPYWYDLHTHFRQGEIVESLIKAHLDMGCAGALAMPNTSPPVGKVKRTDDLPYTSIEEYRETLEQAGANHFDHLITPLYLTKDTTPSMIEDGAKSGLLKACKYYPPHGTTGSEHGWHFTSFIENGIFEALADNDVVLCVHGEEHNMRPEDYFSRKTNAEETFYTERMPKVIDKIPHLKIVGEHLTTKVGVDLIQQAGDNVAATVTPQHLIYTVGHLLHGLKYHLYCMPLVKFEDDRDALQKAVIAPHNTKFFAGTDSAPHTTKATDCGCAAGCFTGLIAPQIYAEGFELAGADLSSTQDQETFRKFLSKNGAAFYGLPVSEKHFTLTKDGQTVTAYDTPTGPVTPLPLGMAGDCGTSTTIPWRIEL